MSHSANHGFALFDVELESRGDKVLTRSRPLNIDLPTDEPVMNPRGMMLEHGATLLEKGQVSLVVLTNGTNDNGEPMLDFVGYIGTCKEPYFHDVQPTSLYNMSAAFYQVSLIKVSFDEEGYREDANAHDAMFIITREGVLKPFEKAGAVLWPQELLDAVRESSEPDPTNAFQMITSDDVQLDTLYYRKHPNYSASKGHLGFDCFVVCRSTEKRQWLSQAKDKIRSELTMIRSSMQYQLDKVEDALSELN